MVHVDDLCILCKNRPKFNSIINDLKKQLTEIRTTSTSENGHATYLGREIHFHEDHLKINQTPYILEVCKRYNIRPNNAANSTPFKATDNTEHDEAQQIKQ